MKQQSAISSRVSATIENASSDRTGRVCKLWSFLAIVTVLMLTAAAGDTSNDRYNDLGHRLLCTCYGEPIAMGPSGQCGQVLLECNHLGCNTSDRMRGELRAALEKGDKDEVILRGFVQRYGTNVLVQSSIINKLVWIVAIFALATLSLLVIVFVRGKQSHMAAVARTPLSTLDPTEVDMLRRRVRAQTENDDW
jgi:cytochrome c-type biogenesis protein CcmH